MQRLESTSEIESMMDEVSLRLRRLYAYKKTFGYTDGPRSLAPETVNDLISMANAELDELIEERILRG